MNNQFWSKKIVVCFDMLEWYEYWIWESKLPKKSQVFPVFIKEPNKRYTVYGILSPKLFQPSMRKNCSRD